MIVGATACILAVSPVGDGRASAPCAVVTKPVPAGATAAGATRRASSGPGRAAREAASRRMGFGLRRDAGRRPGGAGHEGLIDNAAGRKHQIALLWQARRSNRFSQRSRELPTPDCVPTRRTPPSSSTRASMLSGRPWEAKSARVQRASRKWAPAAARELTRRRSRGTTSVATLARAAGSWRGRHESVGPLRCLRSAGMRSQRKVPPSMRRQRPPGASRSALGDDLRGLATILELRVARQRRHAACPPAARPRPAPATCRPPRPPLGSGSGRSSKALRVAERTPCRHRRVLARRQK